MQKGDYIKIGGRLKCIKILCGTVIDIQDHCTASEAFVSCHIPITSDILEACGFVKNDDKYIATLNKEDGIECIIEANLRPLQCEYKLFTIVDGNKIIAQNQIVILSVLQDWVRINTGCELVIDEQKLANIVNR